ncbi:MAG: hypothetical protein WAM39_15625 [Bryobacteraceae bacterium]
MKHIPDDELALCAGNEFDGASHLNECAECRSKLEELRSATDWLKRTATEPNEEQLDALRSGVLRAVSRRQILWPYVAAAAAIAVVLAARGFRDSIKESAPAVITTIAQTPIQSSAPIGLGPLVYKVHRRIRAQAPAMTLLANHGGDPVIRLRTTDPNVVVLWVMNTKPEDVNHNE